MEHEINRGNWTMHLAGTIEKAENGDTIICHSDAMVELAKRAAFRMCPKKTLTFTITSEEVPAMFAYLP